MKKQLNSYSNSNILPLFKNSKSNEFRFVAREKFVFEFSGSKNFHEKNIPILQTAGSLDNITMSNLWVNNTNYSFSIFGKLN